MIKVIEMEYSGESKSYHQSNKFKKEISMEGVFFAGSSLQRPEGDNDDKSKFLTL